MAMLAALCAVAQKEEVFCLHVEHGLRPAEESSGDAEFVRDFCEKRGINCRIVSIPPGKIASFARRRGTGIEAAARFFRRRAFFRHAARLGENARILTAHTKDDMLETSLMRVLRGAGPSGLAAMPVTRGKILRPLLGMTRADVIGYLAEKKIPWREDSTNTDEKFLRNRIRRALVPLLNESFPFWKGGLSSLAQTQSLAADFLARETQNRIIWETKNFISKTPCSSVSSVVKNSSGSDTTLGFLSTDEGNFFAQPQIVREEALFQGIDLLLSGAKNPRPIKRSSLRRFCAGGTAVNLGEVSLRREGGKVVLSRSGGEFYERGFSLLIKEPGLYNLKMISVEVRPCCKERFVSGDALSGEGGGFFAALPLVFRRSFKDDFLVSSGKKTAGKDLAKNSISAVDVFGTAAFTGSAGVLFTRDFPAEGRDYVFYFVTIKRLADV